MANLKMVSPWIDFYHKTQAMFKQDKTVTVMFDEDEMTLKLYVKHQEKAEAISKLLPNEKVFGNVTLKIEVIPGNRKLTSYRDGFIATVDQADDAYISKLFELAFNGNSALQYTHVVDGFEGFHATYIVFNRTVVQYYNDSLADIDGKRSTLFETIAGEIFNEFPGVYFCTSSVAESCMPF